MQDPYKVLGIDRNADETEIKKAYRALSKKYHPDNNPGNKAAEEVFKQVQAAYEQIMNEKKNGGSYNYGNGFGSGNGYSGSYSSQSSGESDNPYGFNPEDFFGFGFGGFNGFGGSYSYRNEGPQDKTEQDLQSAKVYINNRYYDQALNVLNSMDEKDDRWYYYSAIANMGMGNNITALEHARTALSMKPDNFRYQELVSNIENGRNVYTGRSSRFEINPSGGGSWCMKIILCNLVLNLCLGGGGFCCGSGLGGGIPPYMGGY